MPDMHSPQTPTPWFTRRFIRNVIIKTLLLLLAANLVFALVHPMPTLGRLSLYNGPFPGRERLAFR